MKSSRHFLQLVLVLPLALLELPLYCYHLSNAVFRFLHSKYTVNLPIYTRGALISNLREDREERLFERGRLINFSQVVA